MEKSVQNKGVLSISPTDYHERDNGKEMRDFDMGMIMINLTNPVQEVGMASSPAIWSRPMPLGKYLYYHFTKKLYIIFVERYNNSLNVMDFPFFKFRLVFC